jgi:anti-sigma-K factor RskA
MTHLTFEQISELAETGDTGNPHARHTAECEACRGSVERVRGLLASARALPREVAPPPEVWSAVRGRLSAEARARSARPARWWHNGWLAAAAALVLVVGTMVATTRFASRGKAAKAQIAQPNPTPASPALFAVDRNYIVTIRELRAALDAQRTRLAPSTIQKVERSLTVIEAAIAEARAALAADPGNQALVDMLASQYERQLDLLQRATELSSSN